MIDYRREEKVMPNGVDRIVVEKLPEERQWHVRHIARNFLSGPSNRLGGVPEMLYSGLDDRSSEPRFDSAAAAMAHGLTNC